MPSSHYHDQAGIQTSRDAPANWLELVLDKLAHNLPVVRPLVHYQHDHPLRPLLHLDFQLALKSLEATTPGELLLSPQEFADHCRSGRISSAELMHSIGEYLQLKFPDSPNQNEIVAESTLGSRESLYGAMIHTPELDCNQDADAWIESLIDDRPSPDSQDRDASDKEFRDWLGVTNARIGEHAASAPEVALIDYLEREALGKPIRRWRDSDWDCAYQYACWWYCKRGARNWQPPFQSTAGSRHTISTLAPKIDESIRLVTIPFLSAFADPDTGKWPLAGRDQGILRCFVETFSQSSPSTFRSPLNHQTLSALLHEHQSLSPSVSIDVSLRALHISNSDASAYLQSLLGVVRGWAGLLYHLSISEYPCNQAVRKFSLAELVSILLLLDRTLMAAELDCRTNSIKVQDWSRALRRKQFVDSHARQVATRQTWLFRLAQQLYWSPMALCRLKAHDWSALHHELNSFRQLDRQLVAQSAYEASYMQAVLKRIQSPNSRQASPASLRPSCLVITCAEPSQESIRRHLEALSPAIVTAGVPGFFNLDIRVKECDSNHFLPRAPSNVRKRHEVSETLMDAPFKQRWLQIEKLSQELRPDVTSGTNASSMAAFTVPEMTAVVGPLLHSVGIASDLPRLVIVMGHESSSVNNLYESVDNCTFCSKQSVRANVQAFVQMANDFRVRDALKMEAVDIPASTFFVAAIHDTCSDQFTVLDVEHIPPSHTAELKAFVDHLRQAAAANAGERCLAFDPHQQRTGAAALNHCWDRQDSGAYACPELSLTGSALCIVGRRETSRGVALGRRAFLFSYDSTQDDEDLSGLARLLNANLPILANICFDYWFSKTAPEHFGAGHKAELTLAASMVAASDYQSDLRTGLPLEMVRTHEPMRLLVLLEAPQTSARRMLAANPRVARFFEHRYMHLDFIERPWSAEAKPQL